MAKAIKAASVTEGMRVGGCVGDLQVVSVERQGVYVVITDNKGESYRVPSSQVLYKLN